MSKIERRFLIHELFRSGNIGPFQIKPIEEQPKDGFPLVSLTRVRLKELMEKGKYPFEPGHKFTIMEVYFIPED